ncbi:hypothetical protein H4R34_003945 [Dimargaris verticillata]|uniref:Homeodomain-like protein n=1 Tax=Dimargaris verticillata TaxID=2761393 RepID=A0A9W8B5W8_9FUNG|nr:hypothetical protein H4R34_003945 [Dimargaris verticillata]
MATVPRPPGAWPRLLVQGLSQLYGPARHSHAAKPNGCLNLTRHLQFLACGCPQVISNTRAQKADEAAAPGPKGRVPHIRWDKESTDTLIVEALKACNQNRLVPLSTLRKRLPNWSIVSIYRRWRTCAHMFAVGRLFVNDYLDKDPSITLDNLNFFLRCQSQHQQTPVFRVRRWSAEEKDRIKSAIYAYGPTDWALISKQVSTRSPEQCYQFWHYHLSPVSQKKWTPEEDQRLLDQVAQNGRRWKNMVPLFPGRNKKGLFYRYAILMNQQSPLFAKRWSPEENQRLKEAVQRYGTKWKEVAAMVGERSPVQCRTRWHKFPQEDRLEGPWTAKELVRLVRAIQSMALNPEAVLIPDNVMATQDHTTPSAGDCKPTSPAKSTELDHALAQFDAELSPVATGQPDQLGTVTPSSALHSLAESDRPLKELKHIKFPHEYRHKFWQHVAKRVGTRDMHQCLNRWRQLRTVLNEMGEPWSPEQDQALQHYIDTIEDQRPWMRRSDLHTAVEGKTQLQCWARINYLGLQKALGKDAAPAPKPSS